MLLFTRPRFYPQGLTNGIGSSILTGRLLQGWRAMSETTRTGKLPWPTRPPGFFPFPFFHKAEGAGLLLL